MEKWRSIAGAILFALISMTLHFPASAQKVESQENYAKSFIGHLSSGDYTAATERFDNAMTMQATPETLQQIWTGIETQCGKFQRQVSVRKETRNCAVVRCQFEKLQLDLLVSFDEQVKIAGFHMLPVVPATELADTPLYKESELSIGSVKWRLPATITVPIGNGLFPAVVLVHGSGPNDRDETIGPNKPFRDLAWGLASKGIAVLRYEKRTRQYAIKEPITVKEETIDDAIEAVELLRKTPRIDPQRVFVIGHSLGATLTPRIGKIDPSIAGFILMAGGSRPFEDSILEQYEYLASLEKDGTGKNEAALDEMRRQVALVKSPALSPDTPADKLPLGVPANYWLDLRGYEPAREAASLKCPMLLLQGGRDYQVTMRDFEIWRTTLKEKSDATFKAYPKLNHLFINGEGPCVPAEYATEGHVDKQVVEDIAAWIDALNRK